MSARYTQSKGEQAKHAEILKAMLKRPENKLCADCKRNDPRWASTNLGCFMCIRCSGIHRGMGVHITRIKSVDLDTWSPEQIVNVQRWGNKRANAYWEAHLKPGHMPPEHKMESFIRSKYETKRWAMEGPMPDPETLDDDAESAPAAAPAPTPTASAPAPAPARKPTAIDLLAGPPRASSSRTAPAPPSASSIPSLITPVATPTPAAPAAPASGGGGGLFDLDFNATAPPAAPVPKKDAKADILSLFASAPPPPPVQHYQQQAVPQQYQQQQHSRQSSFGMGGLNLGGPTQQSSSGFGAGQVDPWGAPPPVQQQQYRPPVSQQQPASSGGWGGFDSYTQPAPPKPSNDFFGGSAATDVWGSSQTSTIPNSTSDPFGEFASGGAGGSVGAKKSDAFSDIWA